jgi:16S rRNA (guanine966-N2)-methyltransferase
VGIEALSRGAAHVTFVERDVRAIRLIDDNLRHCGVTDRYAIIRVEFAAAPARLPGAAFDIVFLDPPYGRADVNDALTGAQALASGDTLVVIEHAKRDAPPAEAGTLVLTRTVVSGDSGLAFYSVGRR